MGMQPVPRRMGFLRFVESGRIETLEPAFPQEEARGLGDANVEEAAFPAMQDTGEFGLTIPVLVPEAAASRFSERVMTLWLEGSTMVVARKGFIAF